jgi:hypothetical protein
VWGTARRLTVLERAACLSLLSPSTLTEAIKQCTHTPMHCRVLVMDRGRALEYGRPAELLQNEDGAFTGAS